MKKIKKGLALSRETLRPLFDAELVQGAMESTSIVCTRVAGCASALHTGCSSCPSCGDCGLMPP